MPTALITGANRGLGLEFAKQYASDGWRVFGGARDPDRADALNRLAEASAGRLSVHALDVTDLGGVDRLASALGGEAIDLLLNNAGVSGGWPQVFGKIDYVEWQEVLRANLLGPTKMIEAFIDHVARSERKLVVTVSSRMGSITEAPGGAYLYRSSKAAVNAVTRNLARDLDGRATAVVVHPGWVRTDMGGKNAALNTTESVTALRAVIAELGPGDSGRYLNYDGSEIPW